MTTLLLVRHGETEWNRERRFQGWQDPPLNDAGREQARVLADQLRDVPFDAVYSSDLKRAYETAEIVAAPHDVPVVADEGLREVDVGVVSGMTWVEAHERYGVDLPFGETREEHQSRVLSAVERIARQHPNDRVLVVTHGGTIRALHRHAIGEPEHPVENCAVLELHFREDRLTAPIE